MGISTLNVDKVKADLRATGMDPSIVHDLVDTFIGTEIQAYYKPSGVISYPMSSLKSVYQGPLQVSVPAVIDTVGRLLMPGKSLVQMRDELSDRVKFQRLAHSECFIVLYLSNIIPYANRFINRNATPKEAYVVHVTGAYSQETKALRDRRPISVATKQSVKFVNMVGELNAKLRSA